LGNFIAVFHKRTKKTPMKFPKQSLIGFNESLFGNLSTHFQSISNEPYRELVLLNKMIIPNKKRWFEKTNVHPVWKYLISSSYTTEGGPRDFSSRSRNPSSLFCRATSHNNATAPLFLGVLRFSYNYAPFDFPVPGVTGPSVSIPKDHRI